MVLAIRTAPLWKKFFVNFHTVGNPDLLTTLIICVGLPWRATET